MSRGSLPDHTLCFPGCSGKRVSPSETHTYSSIWRKMFQIFIFGKHHPISFIDECVLVAKKEG